MADDRLRALERDWKETGGVDAERAFRRAQLRAGVLTPAQLRASAVRQLMVRPSGKLSKGRDPDQVLDELLADDDLVHAHPLPQVNAGVWEYHEPAYRPQGRILAATSDALLADAVTRLGRETRREVVVSPPAVVFRRTMLERDVVGVREYYTRERPTEVHLQIRPLAGDLAVRLTPARSEDAPYAEWAQQGWDAILADSANELAPLVGVAASFRVEPLDRRIRDHEVREAMYVAVRTAFQGPEHVLLEPWVRVQVTGPDPEAGVDVFPRHGGWVEGIDGTTLRGVLTLRRVARLTKDLEKVGVVTWDYHEDMHAPERPEQARELLTAAGWDLPKGR